MAHEEVRLETYSALLGGGMKHETVHPALGIGVLGRGRELRGAKNLGSCVSKARTQP
jgi:hypothetical protein